jgi:hypothetical protein
VADPSATLGWTSQIYMCIAVTRAAYRIKEGQTRTVLLPDSMMWCGVLYVSINFRMESQYFTYCPTASLTDL